MALIYADRVKETTSTTGTGSLALGGAVAKFRTFADAMTTNDTCFYVVEHASSNEWEVGIGTFTSPTTLARTTVLKSSNSNNAVNFSAGTKVLGLTVSASAYEDFLTSAVTAINVTAPIASSGGNTPTISLEVVPVDKGGTNITGYTLGDILYTSATNILSKLGIGSANNVLQVIGGIPAWGLLQLSNAVTGILALANGGTGANLSGTGGANQFLKQSTVGGNVSVGTIGIADIATALTTPTAIGSSTQSTGRFTTLGVNDTPSATEQLAVQASSATVVPIVAQGATSQSANLINILNSAGTALAVIDKDGYLGIGIGVSPSATSSQLSTSYYVTANATSRAIRGYVTAGHTSAPGSISMRAIEGNSDTASGVSTSFANLILYAGIFATTHRGSNTLNTAIGASYIVSAASGAGAISTAIGQGTLINNQSANNITVATGVSVSSALNSGGGSITTFYGIKIENQSVAGTNYAIFTGIGLNQFGDQILIVGSADRIQNIVRANATQTTNLQEWQNSSGTALASISGGGNLTTKGIITSFVSTATNYAVLRTDYTIQVTSNATITLPTAVGFAGQEFEVKALSGVTATMATTGGQTIDGGGFSVTSLRCAKFKSTGSNWIITAQY